MENGNEIVKADEVEFYGQTLLTIEVDRKAFTAMRPIVEHMGLAWSTQYQKIIRNKDKFNCVHMNTVGKDGKTRKMFFMDAEDLNAWLFSINASKVRPTLRDLLISYQRECVVALYNYWQKGEAKNPRKKKQQKTTKDIDALKAERIFKTLVKAGMNFGRSEAKARLSAMHTLNNDYDYDYPASLGLNWEEIEDFLDDSRMEPLDGGFELIDEKFTEWLCCQFQDEERLKYRTKNWNISTFHDDYVSFCALTGAPFMNMHKWTREIRKIFRNHIRTTQRSHESKRYYEFGDIKTCRELLAKRVKSTAQDMFPEYKANVEKSLK